MRGNFHGFDRRRAMGMLAGAAAALALTGCGSKTEESGEKVAAAVVDGQIEKPSLKFGFIKLTHLSGPSQLRGAAFPSCTSTGESRVQTNVSIFSKSHG